MADLLAKLKEIIAKVVKVFKDLIAKITGKPVEEEETTGA